MSSVVLSRQSGLAPRIRRLLGRVRGRGRRRALPEHDPEARRRPDRGSDCLAGERTGTGPTVRLAPSLRPARSLRAARALRVALRGPPLRRRGGLVRRAGGPAGRGARRLGLPGETLLVVTSDHGEGLGEHGEAVHGYFVYESTLRGAAAPSRSRAFPRGTRLPVTVRQRRPDADAARTARRWRAAGDAPRGRSAGGGAARRPRAPGGADVRRIAHAAPALRLERPAQPAGGALQVHPGPAARALRPAQDPGETADLAATRAGQGRGAARRRWRRGCARRAGGRPRHRARAAASRPSCSRSWARSATWARAAP